MADAQELPQQHERILIAAESCFANNGFHRSTMQMVAREAGMSPGNLYRYFSSKDALIIGLVERDLAMVRADFTQFDPQQPFWDQFSRLGEKYFNDHARMRALLCLETWAEACRNPAIAHILDILHQEIIGHLEQVLEGARQRGEVAADVDVPATIRLILTLTDGLYLQHALKPGEDHSQIFKSAMQAIFGILTDSRVLRHDHGHHHDHHLKPGDVDHADVRHASLCSSSCQQDVPS